MKIKSKSFWSACCTIICSKFDRSCNQGLCRIDKECVSRQNILQNKFWCPTLVFKFNVKRMRMNSILSYSRNFIVELNYLIYGNYSGIDIVCWFNCPTWCWRVKCYPVGISGNHILTDNIRSKWSIICRSYWFWWWILNGCNSRWVGWGPPTIWYLNVAYNWRSHSYIKYELIHVWLRIYRIKTRYYTLLYLNNKSDIWRTNWWIFL